MIKLDETHIQLIERVITHGLEYEGVREAEVSVLVTDDTEIRRLNRRFCGKDKATDVLSFPLDGGVNLGDIVISLPRAAEQALAYGHSLPRELAFLTAHGVLHLLGYDHETSPADEATMLAKQEAILTALNIPR